MMKGITIVLSLLLVSHLSVTAQTKADPEKKLKELGIVLKKPPVPIANYVPAVQVGKMVYLSGQGPIKDDGELIKGKVIDKPFRHFIQLFNLWGFASS